VTTRRKKTLKIPLKWLIELRQLVNSLKKELKVSQDREGGVSTRFDNFWHAGAYIADWLQDIGDGRTAVIEMIK